MLVLTWEARGTIYLTDFGLESGRNRSCGHPKKCWLDAIKDDLR